MYIYPFPVHVASARLLTMGGTTASQSAERSLALIAGREAWNDESPSRSAITKVAGVLEAAAFLTAAILSWTYHLAARSRPSSSVIVFAPVAFTIVCLLFSVRQLLLALTGRDLPFPYGARVAGRSVLALALITSAFAVMPGWASLNTWPIGIALGADAALTSWALGWHLRPSRWWPAFVVSPYHLGAVGGLLGAAAFQPTGSVWSTAFPVLIALHLWVIIASLIAWGLNLLNDSEKAERQRAYNTAASIEHQKNAHWLHDDLCAQLRLVSIQVQSRSIELEDVAQLLDDLDHQIRLRQLDAIFATDTVRVAEIIQPWLRRAQNNGVLIDRVPSLDDVSMIVSTEVGREFSHAVSVLTSNALNAGATRISFDVTQTEHHLSIAITDDAGGLNTSELPVGRALWSLQQDLGQGQLIVTRTATGTRVQANVALTERNHRGAVVAR